MIRSIAQRTVVVDDDGRSADDFAHRGIRAVFRVEQIATGYDADKVAGGIDDRKSLMRRAARSRRDPFPDFLELEAKLIEAREGFSLQNFRPPPTVIGA